MDTYTGLPCLLVVQNGQFLIPIFACIVLSLEEDENSREIKLHWHEGLSDVLRCCLCFQCSSEINNFILDFVKLFDSG